METARVVDFVRGVRKMKRIPGQRLSGCETELTKRGLRDEDRHPPCTQQEVDLPMWAHGRVRDRRSMR